jgi:SNF2 family DNA or RNA helicase
MVAYKTHWEEFLKALEEDKLNKLSGTPSTSKGIAELGRLRQKASLLRVESTADLAEEMLQNGHQVAISVEYLRSLDNLKENLEKRGYKVVEYSGRNTKDREEQRKLYQEGKADCIIFSVESSISLHQLKDTDKNRAQINHDLRWSGIEQEQVDGRSHRNGRHCPIYWCFSKGTIEERVATILLSKLEAMNTIRGDQGIDFGFIYKEIQK